MRHLLLTLILIALFSPAFGEATAQKLGPNEAGIVRAWNEAVATIEPEDQLFQELLASLKRNPPGRVVLAPDVRAAQRKRRLALLRQIIALHEARIAHLRQLAKFEEKAQ